MKNRFKINNVAISITDLNDTTNRIKRKVESNSPGYICVTNVRATYFGNHDPNFCRILNNSFLTIPDGKPLEWYAHLSGFKQVQKTSGPDLFERICELSEKEGYTHYFYGSTPEVIKKMLLNLKSKYPHLKIIDAISPPFAPVEELANEKTIEQINKLNPSFVWVGLGAPKQERFMDLIIDKIETSVLIGVGLVFEYQAGTVIRAPKWMQKNGLEWLFRFIQQPLYSHRSIKAFKYFMVLLFKKLIARYGKKEPVTTIQNNPETGF